MRCYVREFSGAKCNNPASYHSGYFFGKFNKLPAEKASPTFFKLLIELDSVNLKLCLGVLVFVMKWLLRVKIPEPPDAEKLNVRWVDRNVKASEIRHCDCH